MTFSNWDLEAIIIVKVHCDLKKKLWTKEIMSHLKSLHPNLHNICWGLNLCQNYTFICISVNCYHISSK